MTFESYKQALAKEFPAAIQLIVQEKQGAYEAAARLKAPIVQYSSEWGFDYPAQAWNAAVPKSDTLTLGAWSNGSILIEEWQMDVTCQALHIAPQSAHIEIRNSGRIPLPFTDTGYRSEFVPLPSFAGGKTVEDFIRHKLKSAMSKNRQLELI